MNDKSASQYASHPGNGTSKAFSPARSGERDGIRNINEQHEQDFYAPCLARAAKGVPKPDIPNNDPRRLPDSRALGAIHIQLQRVLAALIVADADRFVDAAHENLAVADTPCAGRANDGLYRLFLHIVVNNHFDLYLGE